MRGQGRLPIPTQLPWLPKILLHVRIIFQSQFLFIPSSSFPLLYYLFHHSSSVNEVICHGIPDSRPLQDGDIVNIDISVYFKGMHADLNETFCVGTKVPAAQKMLMKVTHDALMLAIREGTVEDCFFSIEPFVRKKSGLY